LTGMARPEAVGGRSSKFPTCALAILTFAGNSWAAVRPASGTLIHFMTPARLGNRPL
jgi:hypothetical protein